MSSSERWREAADPKRIRRRQGPAGQRETLRRWTITAAAIAIGLNALLFVLTGIGQVGPESFQNAITSTINAFFPGRNVQPSSAPPVSGSSPIPIAVTGGS